MNSVAPFGLAALALKLQHTQSLSMSEGKWILGSTEIIFFLKEGSQWCRSVVMETMIKVTGYL